MDLGSRQRLLGELLLKMGSSVSVGGLTAAYRCLKRCYKGSEFKLLGCGGQRGKVQYTQATAGEFQNGQQENHLLRSVKQNRKRSPKEAVGFVSGGFQDSDRQSQGDLIQSYQDPATSI